MPPSHECARADRRCPNRERWRNYSHTFSCAEVAEISRGTMGVAQDEVAHARFVSPNCHRVISAVDDSCCHAEIAGRFSCLG
jgi:hypothetical protein